MPQTNMVCDTQHWEHQCGHLSGVTVWSVLLSRFQGTHLRPDLVIEALPVYRPFEHSDPTLEKQEDYDG